MNDADDPRIYFGTLLAWVRTGLTVIGLGFVVARFGLFLHMIRRDSSSGSEVGSMLIGAGLVLLGSAALAMATWQHVRFCRNLGSDSRPRPYVTLWSVWFAVLVSAVGMLLAGYILLRSDIPD
jgi:putative membrane protein